MPRNKREVWTMSKVVVLASGGLDSSVLLALYKNLGYEVYPLYIHYGNRNSSIETSKLSEILIKLDIPPEHIMELEINFPYSKSSCIKEAGDNLYVEMRNLVFMSYAVSYAQSIEADIIAVGFIKVPVGYPDTSEQFISDFNLMSFNSTGIEAKAPLMKLDKVGVYNLGRKFGIGMKNTFSCNTPVDGKPCGNCPDCKDLKFIMQEAGVKDEDSPFI
jgi:7-cyano-7-deazaguanine synthase